MNDERYYLLVIILLHITHNMFFTRYNKNKNQIE